ncbi:MAG: hypothetical protein JXJ04_16930 [Spirochaetales bacterium]|nr:hypothetical protein [Spirochaetales bacterium]
MSNYYIALGMEKEADVDKIKKAYRVWYKNCSFDIHSKSEQNKSLMEIQESGQTNPVREMSKKSNQYSQQRQFDPVFYQHMENNQKLIRERHIKTFSSVTDDFFGGFVPGFFEYGFSQHKELFLELILSPEEARKGGDFPINVPVLSICPHCHGTGFGESFVCSHCSGFGQIRGSRTFVLHVPAHIKHGDRAKVSLEGIGLKTVFLNLEIIIE